MEGCLINKEKLQKVIQTVFEEDYEVIAIMRVLGGAQKRVYKMECSNLFSCIIYIWDDSLSYFGAAAAKEIFISNSALLFQKNHELLKQNHISVPELYHMDRSKTIFPFEYGLVEYIEGSELEPLLHNQEIDCRLILMDLKKNIEKLHFIKSSTVGDLRGKQEDSFCCEAYIQESLDDMLDYLFNHYEPIGKLKEQLLKINRNLYECIEKRNEYVLIHNELGPNHVMVDKDEKVYLIDIEGMKFFDIEYEYSFLQLRFGKYYGDLVDLILDENRMKYYKFYHHIACIHGDHHLINENYYDLSGVRGMIEYNYNEVLKVICYKK